MTKKILVIENDEVNLFLLKDSLESVGYEVLTANVAIEGLRKVRDCNPDLIVLNIMGAGTDKMFLLEEIKGCEEKRNIPVIALCSCSDEVEKKAMQLGAAGFFKKPVDFRRLHSKIVSIFQRKFVLTIGNDPEIFQLLQQRLEFMGCQVKNCLFGKEAGERIKMQKPYLIVIDMAQNGEKVLETIRILKAQDKASDVPIIAVAGCIGKELLSQIVRVIADKNRYLEQETVGDAVFQHRAFSSAENREIYMVS